MKFNIEPGGKVWKPVISGDIDHPDPVEYDV